MNIREWIYRFDGEKNREEMENISFPKDILRIIRDVWNMVFQCIPQFTPENIYTTCKKNQSVLLEWDYLFSNYAFYFWERFLNTRFQYKCETEENLEKIMEYNKNKIGVIMLSPHDASVFESLLYGHFIFQYNKELFQNIYNVPRLWLMEKNSNKYGILMMKSIITLSSKDSYEYKEYKKLIGLKSLRAILEKSSWGSNIHMFPEGTKRMQSKRWMNPIVDNFVRLLDKQVDREKVRIMTANITDLTAWTPPDILKKHTPSIHFSEPIHIDAVFETNTQNMPDDFEMRYKKAAIIQGMLELKKEFKKRKKKNMVLHMQEMIDSIDTDEKNLDICYKNISHFPDFQELPLYRKEWFQSLHSTPKNDEQLLKSWQVGRFIAEKIPKSERGIYALENDV